MKKIYLAFLLVLVILLACASTPKMRAQFFLGQHINYAIKYYEKHRLGPDEDFMVKLDPVSVPFDLRGDLRGDLTPYGFEFRPEDPEHGNICRVIFLVDETGIIQGFLPLECE